MLAGRQGKAQGQGSPSVPVPSAGTPHCPRPQGTPALGPSLSLGPAGDNSAPAPTGARQPRPEAEHLAQSGSRGALFALHPGSGRGPAPVSQPRPCTQGHLGRTPPVPAQHPALSQTPDPASPQPLTPARPRYPSQPPRRPGPDPGPPRCLLGNAVRSPRPGGGVSRA